MFENLSSSEWLLYISEWPHQDQNVSNNISNIRVTTKVAVHSLLSNSEDLQIRGAAIIHNLACKEVKTVVCILSVQLTFSSFGDFRFHFCNSLLQALHVSKASYRKFIILQLFKILRFSKFFSALYNSFLHCRLCLFKAEPLKQCCRRRDMKKNCLTLKRSFDTW